MSMKRVWIQMPPELYEAAEQLRKKRFLPSFTEYVRGLIRKDLAATIQKETEEEETGVDIKALAKALADQGD